MVVLNPGTQVRNGSCTGRCVLTWSLKFSIDYSRKCQSIQQTSFRQIESAMDEVSRTNDSSSESGAFSDFNEMNASLSEMDARALILTVAAFAEDSLGHLLREYLLPNKASEQLVSGFNAPLGTFSARIKGAFALGLITKEQFDDLEHLRKIRNTFSHTWRPISIDNPSIAGRIKALSFSSLDDVYPNTLFQKLQTSLSALLMELQVSAQRIRKESRTARLHGSGLIIGIQGEGADEQIGTAREALKSIERQLVTAQGDELEFYISRLRAWGHRLGVILRQPQYKAQHREVVTLMDYIDRRLVEFT